MPKTTIICTRLGAHAPADILEKRDRFMKVVMVAMTDMPISMYKKTQYDEFYVGSVAGLEFTSTGESI